MISVRSEVQLFPGPPFIRRSLPGLDEDFERRARQQWMSAEVAKRFAMVRAVAGADPGAIAQLGER